MNDKAMVEPLNTKAVEPCGGCGEIDPKRRCIGCLHEFFPKPLPKGMEEILNRQQREHTDPFAPVRRSPALPAVDVGEVRAWEHVLTGLVRQKHDKPSVGMAEGDYAPLVRQSALTAAESRVQSLEEEVKRLREAVERSNTALNDWLNVYAGAFCNPDIVAEAQARIGEFGTIAYIASVTAQNRAALKDNGNG